MVGLTFAVLNVGTVAAQAEVNPLESNTGPGQQEEMSEFVDATDGSPNLSTGDRAGVDAAADKVTLEASAEAYEKNKAARIAFCFEIRSPQFPCETEWEDGRYDVSGSVD